MQRAARFAHRIEPPRLRAHALRVEVGERVEFRIQPLDLPDVRLGQLRHRDLARAQQLKQSRRRGQHNIVHGCVPGDDCGARSSRGADGKY